MCVYTILDYWDQSFAFRFGLWAAWSTAVVTAVVRGELLLGLQADRADLYMPKLAIRQCP